MAYSVMFTFTQQLHLKELRNLVKMAEGFLDTCWDANNKEEESNGSGTDADEDQELVLRMLATEYMFTVSDLSV